MKKSFCLFVVLFSVTVCGVANAGNEFLPGIYHILFLACEGQVLPTDESSPLCEDGLDNDCDGLVDIDDPGCANSPPTFINVNVPGTRNLSNTVTVNVTANKTVTISNVSGQVCLGGAGVACTGPLGITAAACNVTTDECDCPAQCSNANYGALLRDSCNKVINGSTFNSGSGTLNFFVNGDCNPSNNSGSYSFRVSD